MFDLKAFPEKCWNILVWLIFIFFNHNGHSLSVIFIFRSCIKTWKGARGGGGGIIYIIVVTLYHFTSMFSFILEYRNIEREHRPEIDFFFLSRNITKIYTLGGWIQLISNQDLCSQEGKSWISILHCTMFLLL